MFSGITRGLFHITQVTHKDNMLDYAVEVNSELVNNMKIGSSVSINGVCQSITYIKNNEIYFTAIAETLRCTTLKQLQVNQLVNLEPSLRYGDEIGGHLLSGHITGTAKIITIHKSNENFSMTFQCPLDWMKYIVPKGFIGIDGCSLTIGVTDLKGKFTVHLIPETLRVTHFKEKQLNEEVNIELDSQAVLIVNNIERFLKINK